jgi:hypothetical protein
MDGELRRFEAPEVAGIDGKGSESDAHDSTVDAVRHNIQYDRATGETVYTNVGANPLRCWEGEDSSTLVEALVRRGWDSNPRRP